MIFLWLVLWLIKGTPDVEFADWQLNNWAIAAAICIIGDLIWSRRPYIAVRAGGS